MMNRGSFLVWRRFVKSSEQAESRGGHGKGDRGKRVYAAPSLVEFGSVEDLTQSGPIGGDDAGFAGSAT